MRQLRNWLFDDIKPWYFLLLPGIGLLSLVLTMLGGLLSVHFLHSPHFSENVANAAPVYQRAGIGAVLFSICVIAPLFEESIFRVAPFAVVRFFTEEETGHTRFVAFMLTALVTSCIFGVAHGDYGNIFAQGVAGLVLAFTFLKFGGANRNLVMGWGASICVHAFHNFFYIVLVFVLHWL